jgi:hypothetical protein
MLKVIYKYGARVVVTDGRRNIPYDLLPGKTAKEFQELLDAHPKAKIVRSLDHEPYINQKEMQLINASAKTVAEIASWKRVRVDGVDEIDEFGMHVYEKFELDLTGLKEDIDLRY